MELNDELLCAYLDGELDATRRARVAEALEADAGGRVRLERMRVADERLRRDVPPHAATGTDAIADYIQRFEVLPASTPVVRSARRWQVPVALAAAAACVAFGFVLARLGPSADDPAQRELQAALESRASGESVRHADASLNVLMTMTTPAGTVCRLFESHGTGRDAEGVACREAGGWHVVALDRTVPPGGYQTASASALLDAAMDRLDATPLDAAQEREWLARGWQPPARLSPTASGVPGGPSAT